MALIFNVPDRDLNIRGTITLTTGAEIALSPENVVDYSISERAASTGFALGEAQAATYTLTIDNSEHNLTALQLSGAKVRVEAGVYVDNAMQYVPFGVWYITESALSEQSAVAVLDGSDALELKFNSVFEDAKGNYPRTVGSLLQSVCSLAGVELASSTFLNSGVSISKKPSWEEETSLRGVVAYIAAVAGGFARITRDGKLEIVSYGAKNPVGTITPDTYMTMETGNGSRFSFNCLGVKLVKDKKFTRYTLSALPDSASNTLQVDGNPLYSKTIAESVKNALIGFESDGIAVSWIGDPTLRIGDTVIVEAMDGVEYALVVNSQDIRYDGGLSASTEASLATETSSSSGYNSTEPAINADGMVNGSKLVAESVAAEKIAAEAITAEKIAAGAIEADKIAAGAITADKIAADAITAKHITAGAVETDKLAAHAVTAEKIAAGAVTAEHIAAGSITADMIDTDKLEADVVDAVIGEFDKVTVNSDLYASFAHIIELAAGSISAGNIAADKLAAALAEVISLHAKTGDFDLATVQNLLSEALILQQGQAGSMMITNLAVTSANLLNATIGELVLKGSDGRYYRVYVGADGTIHTEVATVSQGEINAGQTAAGRQIVETMANIGSLNAQNIKGQSAIIDTIVTTALTAGKITASEALLASATIPALYTTAITAIGNSLDLSARDDIKLMVARKNATYYRDTEPEDVTAGDTWINPTAGKTYIVEGLTGKNTPEFDFGADAQLMVRFGDEADDFEFRIADDGSLMSSNQDAQIDGNGELNVKNRWVEVAPAELHTSYIDIMQDRILINSGGNIKITAGGKLDVNAGAAHFSTSDYTLSILAGDGTEDTVLDFDSESKTLRVDEVNANNVRPYIPGVTAVNATVIGGLDGLANMLAAARYEHVVYTQGEDDYSTSPVVIEGSDTIQIDIVSNFRSRIAPLSFKNVASNVWIENVKWDCTSETAIAADSGNIRIKNCVANAKNGIVASKHAHVTWIGADNTIDSAGVCSVDAFNASDGATIRANGMIPSGGQNKATGGVLEMIDTYVGSGGAVVPETEEVTTTLTATFGYYGSKSYWNDGELFQGYTNAKGEIYGCMKFTLPSDIESIVSATLTLKAKSSIGTGANVKVAVYGSSTAYKNKPTLGTRYINKNNAVAAGQSCSLNATSAATALFDGTAKQLVLNTGETSVLSGKAYSKHYAQFTSAKLKITYRRAK